MHAWDLTIWWILRDTEHLSSTNSSPDLTDSLWLLFGGQTGGEWEQRSSYACLPFSFNNLFLLESFLDLQRSCYDGQSRPVCPWPRFPKCYHVPTIPNQETNTGRCNPFLRFYSLSLIAFCPRIPPRTPPWPYFLPPESPLVCGHLSGLSWSFMIPTILRNPWKKGHAHVPSAPGLRLTHVTTTEAVNLPHLVVSTLCSGPFPVPDSYSL